MERKQTSKPTIVLCDFARCSLHFKRCGNALALVLVHAFLERV